MLERDDTFLATAAFECLSIPKPSILTNSAMAYISLVPIEKKGGKEGEGGTEEKKK